MSETVIIWMIADAILLYLYCKILGLRTRETWYIFIMVTVTSAIAISLLNLVFPNS